MVTKADQREQFRSRLKRIKPGAPNTLGQIYVGPAEELEEETTKPPHFGVFATVFSLLLGALAYFIGNLVQFHMTSGAPTVMAGSGWTYDMVMASFGDVLLALIALIIIVKIVRMRGMGPYLAGALGLFVMMGMQTTVIRSAPELYSALYSPEYVSQHTVPDYRTIPF